MAKKIIPNNQPKSNEKPNQGQNINEVRIYSNGGKIGESQAQQDSLKKGAEVTPRPKK